MDKLRGLPAAVLLLAVAVSTHAASGIEPEPASNDVDNIASLQRGARNFMNYCSGCHSAKYVRYKTIAEDLQLSEDQVVSNLMFNAEKTFETIQSAMPASAAARWYGTAPPDLSLMARARGADYIYNFLKGFYVDPESPTGVDNVVLAGTSMPNVLWELQGYQDAVFEDHTEELADGSSVTTRVFSHFEPVTSGSLDAEDFDEFVRDTVNFLAFISEPIRSDRRKLGVWVLMYLIVFWIIAVMLKKQIWKDVK